MTHKQWFNNVLHLHPVHEEIDGHFQRCHQSVLTSNKLRNEL